MAGFLAMPGYGRMISQELLDILACPLCKTPVRLEGATLVCTACGRRYPIRDGIPYMRPEDGQLPPTQAGSAAGRTS